MLFKDLLLLGRFPAHQPYYAQFHLGAMARDINFDARRPVSFPVQPQNFTSFAVTR